VTSRRGCGNITPEQARALPTHVNRCTDAAMSTAEPTRPRAAPSRTLRVLLAKPGLDGHDRGIHVIAAALRDAGFEVIYTGLRQTPAAIVQAALQEDVDAIGLSSLSGAHMSAFSRVLKEMREQGLDDVLLFGGGIIPAEDATALKAQGVGELFGPGTPMAEIIAYLERAARPKV
jgi:methylmalonyl-CoA mutase C-terminal domain/subunit